MQTAPRNQVSLGLKEESYGKSLRVRILLTPEDNDLRDTDKSRYFGCCHILITSWQLGEAICHFSLRENVVPITHPQNIRECKKLPRRRRRQRRVKNEFIFYLRNSGYS